MGRGVCDVRIIIIIIIAFPYTHTPGVFIFSGGNGVKPKGVRVKKLKHINMINKNVLSGETQFRENVIYLLVY